MFTSSLRFNSWKLSSPLFGNTYPSSDDNTPSSSFINSREAYISSKIMTSLYHNVFFSICDKTNIILSSKSTATGMYTKNKKIFWQFVREMDTTEKTEKRKKNCPPCWRASFCIKSVACPADKLTHRHITHCPSC